MQTDSTWELIVPHRQRSRIALEHFADHIGGPRRRQQAGQAECKCRTKQHQKAIAVLAQIQQVVGLRRLLGQELCKPIDLAQVVINVDGLCAA